MAKIKESLYALRFVYKRPSYLISSIIIAILFFLFNILIQNFSILKVTLQNSGLLQALKLMWNIVLGSPNSFSTSSYVVFIIVSILIGIAIPLLVFKVKVAKISATKNKAGFLGIVMGVLAPGCVSCGIGLLPLLGLSGAVAILPYRGLELGFLSIILLLFTIYVVGKDIYNCPLCKGYKNKIDKEKL